MARAPLDSIPWVSLPPPIRDVSPTRYRVWTRWAIWALTAIVVTGGAVRLTGSGLGCSDWPNCEEDQFVADLEYHALIEFVNRLFTGVVAVAVALAVLGSLARIPRRRDLVVWSWGLVVGVLGQVVLGALLVVTHLDPRFNMGHFLLSMVLLWNAAVLHHLAAVPETADGQRIPLPAAERTTGPLATLVRLVSAVGVVLLVTGTIVTGSGPHSGSDEPEVAERLPFLVRDVTRVHAIVAMSLLVLVVMVVRTALREGRPELQRRASIVAGLLVVQGTVGYTQYFTGVPVLLVGIHIFLASVTWDPDRVAPPRAPSAAPGRTGAGAGGVTAPVVTPVRDPETEGRVGEDRPWKVVVWDDPINLMTYVTFVFRKLFGFSEAKAHRLMLQVHTEGRAVVSSGTVEKAENDVFRLHEHGLWATMEKDE